MPTKGFNPFQAGGATSRNALKKYLKADEKNNFETIMTVVNSIANEVANISKRLEVIEKEIQELKQLSVL